jgi:hypothetical protein
MSFYGLVKTVAVFIVESHDLLAERPWSKSLGIGGCGDGQFW